MKPRSHLITIIGAFVTLALLFSAAPQSHFSTAAVTAESNVFNVKTFGATGDGKTLDTPAINKTIDAAAAAGGGTVYFPAGNYLSVSIHLKSNIALYLDQGSTIVAADTAPGVTYDLP